MKLSSFSKAFKYCQTETSSQIENFTTEMFCFLWNYLKSDKELKEPFNELKKFFNINDEIESIDTQIPFSRFSDNAFIPNDQVNAIPDICIKLCSNKFVFIEVKVEQQLNIYKNKEDKEFDQIDFYKNIESRESVHLLSKNYIEKEDFDCSHRWYEIYNILESYKSNFVINEFLYFLDENNMGKQSALTSFSSDLLGFIGAFDSILHESWHNSGIKDFYLSRNCYAYKYGFGYYIREKSLKDTNGETNYFLGVNPYSDEKNKISFYISDSENEPKINELKLYKKISKNGFLTENNLSFDELFEKDMKTQIQTIKNWIIDNVKPYFEKCLN